MPLLHYFVDTPVIDSITLGNYVHALKPVNRLIYLEFFYYYFHDYENAFSNEENLLLYGK